MTVESALHAGTQLFRAFCVPGFSGKVVATRGNRYTSYRGGVLHINTEAGWRELARCLSYPAARLQNRPCGQSPERLLIELGMAKMLVSQQLMAWTPKPKAVKVAVKKGAAKDGRAASLAALDKLDARIKSWLSKQRRAETALKKLRRQRSAVVAAAQRNSSKTLGVGATTQNDPTF